MKVISYTALLYGKDYLGYAIRSVIDHVDEHHILYSPIGAHGHRTDTPCPETRDELYAIAQAAAGDKLRWHDGEWAHEGLQRDSIFEYAPDADVILVVDADEIWPRDTVLSVTRLYPIPDLCGGLRLPMVHFWRSMWKAVLHDPAYPVRVLFPRGRGYEVATMTEATWPGFNGDWTEPLQPIAHMGYAQRSQIIEYKLETHGHKGEFRKDVDWLKERFLANAQHDCHPVGSEFWNPESVHPMTYLPYWMATHPYFDKDIID